ncbi:MAG: hypothetical protein CR972_04825 [Candidatus Moraniibacteriota bacterium]|nr:MAG: hypothetical protein CR972_04825 [Candidatus Moranbacteria bacterium]
MWVLLSLCGALGQAVSMALKKKLLQVPRINNVIGFVSFLVAGIIFAFIQFSVEGSFWHPDLSLRFWYAMFWYAGLNVLAVYFMYKALDLMNFSVLTPFMALTSLSMIIPPAILLNEFPSGIALVGIIIVVIGSIIISKKKKGDNGKPTIRGIKYFLVTIGCYTIAPTATKISIAESSPIFSSMVVHLLISLGFLLMIFLFREKNMLRRVIADSKLLFIIVLAGVLIVMENGCINIALKTGLVANVFAIKRVMPIFGLIIGLIFFKERLTRRIVLSAILMIIGAVLITLF